MDQIGEYWFNSKLAQQRRDLAAVVSAVISEVLQRLPDWILIVAEIDGLIFHDAIKVGLLQFRYERQQGFRLWLPMIAKCSHRLKA